MGTKESLRGFVYSNPSIRDAWLTSQKIKRRARYLIDYGVSDWFFDKWNGIESAGAASPGELTVSGPHGANATPYLPVRPPIFQRALSALKIDYAKYSFVDIGSGKGRAVFLASRFPFHKLIGVEFARELYDQAVNNSRVWSVDDSSRIEFVWKDALEFEFPREPSVLFLYHPFGPDIMGALLDRIRGSIEEFPREIIMVYVNPENEAVIRSRFPAAEMISSFARKHRYVAYRLSPPINSSSLAT
jgi:SAM-dependent methyltransferase